jgi:hypothetical protein
MSSLYSNDGVIIPSKQPKKKCVFYEFNIVDSELNELMHYNIHKMALIKNIFDARGRSLYCLQINDIFNCMIVLNSKTSKLMYANHFDDFCEYLNSNILKKNEIFYPNIGIIKVIVV